MPIYEFKCDVCKAEREVLLPYSEVGKSQECDCGQGMRRKFSPIHFTIVETGRDKILGVLNQEEGAGNFPGGGKHRDRYEKAMAKGLDLPKPVIGKGF